MEKVIHIQRGKLYEDFEIGEEMKHHWGKTITKEETILFSNLTLNHNPLYFNDEYAKSLGYNGIIINPLLVYNTVLGLSVEDLTEAGGPFLGIDYLKFFNVSYPNDTIYAKSITLSKRVSKSRPGWGIVGWKTTGYNQKGEILVEYTRSNLSKMKS